jgi:peptidoglycan/LPS O-acetylase OafA/YrhL
MATVAAAAEAPARLDAAAEGVRAEAGTIAAMDGLRGLSVTWILLFHYTVLRAASSDPWAAMLRDAPVLGRAIGQGPFAVDLFFLISGFLLTLPWLMRARDRRPAPGTRRFYVRRIARIVPAYYVHLLALFAIVMPLLHGPAYWRSDLYVYAANAVAHALFLHNLSPLTSGSLGVNGALWTLAVEAQFYLVLPWLAPVFARAPWRSLAAAAAVSAAWVAGAHDGFDTIVRWHLELGRHWDWQEDAIRRLLAMQLPAYLAHFALGAMLARFWLARAAMPRWLPTAVFAAGIATLTAVTLGAHPLGDLTWLACVAAIGGIVLGCACGRGAAAQTLLARGPLAFMGRISYSAYLWHLPLLLVLQSRVTGAGGAFFPIYVAGVAAAGWMSWRWVERPFMRRRGAASAGPRRAP